MLRETMTIHFAKDTMSNDDNDDNEDTAHPADDADDTLRDPFNGLDTCARWLAHPPAHTAISAYLGAADSKRRL